MCNYGVRERKLHPRNIEEFICILRRKIRAASRGCPRVIRDLVAIMYLTA